MKRIVWIIPHTHYDAEVFIVEKETLEIGYANLLGALRLLRDQPSFKFTLDQTCYIEPFLATYPEALGVMHEMIAMGRLEIVGGMHSMPDENIPSGESFIRNVLYGKASCQRAFGVEVRGGWPIDTFGHHPQIPQLMVKCGFDYAAFQRLMKRGSPADFYWQGIDGTRLLCHWMPRSYAVFYDVPSNLPEFTPFAQARIKTLAQHALTPNLMGPAGADIMPVQPQLIEMAQAYNASQDDVELRLATPTEYFNAIRASGVALPTVTDDLNPVFQGCYSARIDVKQWNRNLETLLVNAEKYDALAQRFGAAPQGERIWEAWRGVLFNQAHDIIGGCHVDAVFNNTMDRFKYSDRLSTVLLNASLQTLADHIDTSGEGVPVVVFNPLGWARADVVECTAGFTEPGTLALVVHDSVGHAVPSDLLHVERYGDGSIRRATVLFIAHDVPSFGYEVYHILPGKPKPGEGADVLATSHPQGGLLRFELDRGWLENDQYRLEFDLWGGVITRLYDKANHWEVLPSDSALGMGNLIVKERDFGNFWQYNGPCKGDAFYPMEGRYPLPELNDPRADYAHTYHGDGNIHHGNAMIEFNISHPYGTGHVGTRVRLYASLPRIDIQTMVLNNDERVRYRAALPTSIRGGTITHEIPFGAIERPEGEFPAQNWIDYSGDGHGVMLLNRGLPGNNVVDGAMLVSLLKCTGLKEGYGDFGTRLGVATEGGLEKNKPHTFDYAIVTHTGDWRAAQAYRRGAEFNVPLLAVKPGTHTGSLDSRMSWLAVKGDQVVLSSVRACPGGMIVRVYEAEGQRLTSANLECAWPLRQAYEVNLIEQEPRDLVIDEPGHSITFEMGPFEIKTFQLRFAGQ